MRNLANINSWNAETKSAAFAVSYPCPRDLRGELYIRKR